MANFLQSPNVALQPYTPSVDTGLYANVLHYKDDQYRQGLAKVQSSIDSVAGLEVYRPVDKQYLQEKMNGIKSQVESLAGGDFSQQAVAGQVASLASQVYKDDRIKQNVIDSSKVKSYFASAKEKKEKHPEQYTPSAENWDMQHVSDYLNSTDPEKSYNGPSEASNYYDYNKPLGELLKGLSPDISYTLDDKGKLQYNIDKNSTISPAKIQNAINGFFATNPQYQQSTNMDALYTYKDYNTADGLKQHVENYYDKTIKSYTDQNVEYDKLIAADPHNVDLIARATAYKADNLNIANSLTKSKNQQLDYFHSGNLDQVKLTLYNDQIRNTGIIDYQKNNHEFDTKETALGKNFLPYIKEGLDPETGLPLSQNSPYYASYIMAKSNEKKSKDRTNSAVSDLTTVIGDPNKTKAYTTESNRTQIQGLQSQQDNYLSKLQTSYNTKFPNAKSPQEFQNYIATQQSNLENGKSVDPDYLKYKEYTQSIETTKGALEQDYKQTAEKSALAHPVSSLGVINIDGLNLEANGKSYKVLKLDPSKKEDQEFLSTFNSFYKDVNNYIENNTSQSIGVQGEANEHQPTQEEAKKAVLQKYRGSQHYTWLEALAEKNLYGNVQKQLVKPFQDVMQARLDDQDKLMQEKGKIWSYNINIVDGKPDEINTLKRLIRAEANTNQLDISKDEKDIEPLGTYADINGKQYIRISDKGVEKDIPYSGNQTIVPNYDPYRWLTNVIKTSGTTPVTGQGVLNSTNGLLRYAISEDTWSGGYNAALVDAAGNKLPIVNDDGISFSAPGQIVERMNTMSKNLNPYTKQQFTREDATYYLTHSAQDFAKYMLNKTNQ
jgi:hypothetical protein